MYGFNEFVDLAPEDLLKVVDQKRIFKDIFQEEILYKPAYYKSPFRDDEYPTCYFECMSDGLLFFVDFGDYDRTHRTCIHAVQDFYKLSYYAAIQFIYNHYIKNENITLKPIERNSYYSKEYTKAPFQILYTKRDYVRSDIMYWSQFGIIVDELKEDNVYAIKGFRSIGSKKAFSSYIFKHGYAIDFVDAVKIYQPYNNKFKWYTNCNENHIGNIDNIDITGDNLVITKSYKDHRVIRNLFPELNVIWFQNEGCSPSEEILLSLLSRYNKITILYDNDNGGTKSSEAVKGIFNKLKPNSCSTIFIPKREKDIKLYGQYIKDTAEYRKREGKTDTIKMLTKIGINGNT